MLQAGKDPMLEGSIVKDLGTLWQQRNCRTRPVIFAAFIDGDTHDRTRFDHLLAHATVIVPKLTIQGGTTEVLRGIIARGLGLREGESDAAAASICRSGAWSWRGMWPPLRADGHRIISSMQCSSVRSLSVLEALDTVQDCRAIMLAACRVNPSLCGGANFGGNDASADAGRRDASTAQLYREAVRLFRTAKPIVVAVHGAAIGGGLGLALVGDFRVTCAEATFSANFTKLGFHPGFGLTVTLPELVGRSTAELLFLTSRRIKGSEAHRIGLANILAAQSEVRETAVSLAREIACCAPLGVVATRATMRQHLADRIAAATEIELAQQSRVRNTDDFNEGILASNERREPSFRGR